MLSEDSHAAQPAFAFSAQRQSSVPPVAPGVRRRNESPRAQCLRSKSSAV